jgi:hypothetical protein
MQVTGVVVTINTSGVANTSGTFSSLTDSSATTHYGAWASLQLPYTLHLRSFRISRNGHSSGATTRPTSATILGSNDGGTTKEFITTINLGLIEINTRFYVDSGVSYSQYYFSFPTVNDASSCAFSGLVLSGDMINISNSASLFKGPIGIGTTNPESKLSVFGPDQVDSFDAQCILASSSTTGAINGGGVLQFQGYDGANLKGFATVSGLKENGTSGDHASYLRFSTRTNGVSSITERMRITSTGNVGIGTASPWSRYRVLYSMVEWWGCPNSTWCYSRYKN